MKRALIAVLAAVLLLGVLACRCFVTDSIMDKGGMENPDAAAEIVGSTK